MAVFAEIEKNYFSSKYEKCIKIYIATSCSEIPMSRTRVHFYFFSKRYHRNDAFHLRLLHRCVRVYKFIWHGKTLSSFSSSSFFSSPAFLLPSRSSARHLCFLRRRRRKVMCFITIHTDLYTRKAAIKFIVYLREFLPGNSNIYAFCRSQKFLYVCRFRLFEEIV